MVGPGQSSPVVSTEGEIDGELAGVPVGGMDGKTTGSNGCLVGEKEGSLDGPTAGSLDGPRG